MARLTPEELEARLHAVLREQPSRRAPGSLEHRVLAEIARREALPWWHKSYRQWPTPVRVAFLAIGLTAAGVIALLVMNLWGGRSLQASLAAAVQPAVDVITTFRAAGTALFDVVMGWIPQISPLWIYAGLGVIGTAYATLIGLGATAYRLLLQPR